MRIVRLRDSFVSVDVAAVVDAHVNVIGFYV